LPLNSLIYFTEFSRHGNLLFARTTILDNQYSPWDGRFGHTRVLYLVDCASGGNLKKYPFHNPVQKTKNMKKTLLICSCLALSLLARSVHASVNYWDPEGTYSYAGSGSNGDTASLSSIWENKKWIFQVFRG
jgi:hypothetical protein